MKMVYNQAVNQTQNHRFTLALVSVTADIIIFEGKLKNIFLPLLFIISFILGCSSHIERSNQSMDNYVIEINKELSNKNVFVRKINNSNIEGEFISINNSYILLKTSSDTLKITNSNVHTIVCKKSGPSWFVGALAGFALGGMTLALFGSNIDIAHGGGNTSAILLFAIPAFTFIGAVGATAIPDYYKTYVINE